jgi:hypothetical protein
LLSSHRSSPFSLLCSLTWCTPSVSRRHHGRAAVVRHAHEHTQSRCRALLHLSVTVLSIPSCHCRERQHTDARVSVEPSTPSSNLFGHLESKHRRLNLLVLLLSLCRRRARAVGFVPPPWPRRRRLHKCECIHPRGRTPLLSLSNPCTHARQGETLLPLSDPSAHARTHARERASTPA